MDAMDRTAASPMRIVYFTEWCPYGETGVMKKVIAQTTAWEHFGHHVLIVVIAPAEERPLAEGFQGRGEVISVIHRSAITRFPWARLGFLNKVFAVTRARRLIRDYCPDVIYYRQQGPWYPGVASLFGDTPMVLEVNTDEEKENRLWGRSIALFHRNTSAWLRRRAAGFVGVTNEITATLQPSTVPRAIIPNALFRPVNPHPPTKNVAPRFLFVGSRLMGANSWHGIDLVHRLAMSLPQFEFTVVGMTADDFPDLKPISNLRFLGPLYGDNLDNVYRNHDIGISTLALFRKGIVEACPLKTREYLSYGLPVVIAYEEAEPRLNAAPYVLRIKTQDVAIETSALAVKEFAESWVNRRVTDNLGFLSSESVELKRLNFLADVAKTRQDNRENACSSLI